MYQILFGGFNDPFTFPLESEANIPQKQRTAKMVKATLTLLRKNRAFSGVTFTLPMYMENRSVTIPMLSIFPVSRMVPRVAEATP